MVPQGFGRQGKEIKPGGVQDSVGKVSIRKELTVAGNNVTGETFKAEVLNSPVPVLVDFYADWCGPSRAMNPTLVELAGEANGRYKVVKVDADAEGELSNDYQIRALPTVGSIAGRMSKRRAAAMCITCRCAVAA
jgi:thioredoxin-like negative regulator of GroEL